MTEEAKPIEPTAGNSPATILPSHPGIYASAVVGELGRSDIQVLAEHAQRSHRILEFGCGGSTMLFAQFSPPGSRIVSLDTERGWIDRTRDALKRLDANRVEFLPYAGWAGRLEGWPWFDLVFVDGLESERMNFAAEAWRLLQPGGVMIYHDGLWAQVVEMVLRQVGTTFQSVDSVTFCAQRSNCIVIRKKVELPFGNDPIPDRPEPWMSAKQDLPSNWPVR